MSGEAFETTEVTVAGARATVRRAHVQALCDGHFPDEPLLPGAYVLGLMADLASVLLAERGSPGRQAGVVQSSFLRPLRPRTDVTLRAHLEHGAGETTVTVEACSDGHPAARATLRFT